MNQGLWNPLEKSCLEVVRQRQICPTLLSRLENSHLVRRCSNGKPAVLCVKMRGWIPTSCSLCPSIVVHDWHTPHQHCEEPLLTTPCCSQPISFKVMAFTSLSLLHYSMSFPLHSSQLLSSLGFMFHHVPVKYLFTHFKVYCICCQSLKCLIYIHSWLFVFVPAGLCAYLCQSDQGQTFLSFK